MAHAPALGWNSRGCARGFRSNRLAQVKESDAFSSVPGVMPTPRPEDSFQAWKTFIRLEEFPSERSRLSPISICVNRLRRPAMKQRHSWSPEVPPGQLMLFALHLECERVRTGRSHGRGHLAVLVVIAGHKTDAPDKTRRRVIGTLACFGSGGVGLGFWERLRLGFGPR